MRVSVIIPTYNYAQFVTEAIDSVLSQTRLPHEVIIVDDGSTDDTRARVARYGDRVRYIFQENRGLSAARNAGLAAATGDALALLDSDDAFHPRKLEFQVAYLEANPTVGLVGTRTFSDASLRWPKLDTPLASTLPLEAHVIRTLFCPSSALFRRTLQENIGDFDRAVSGSADRDYWIRAAAASRVAVLQSPLTFYRLHAGSMNRNAVMMIAHEKAVLDQSFAMPELRHRFFLRRRAYGLAALSAAYMLLQDAGRSRAAAVSCLKSFLYFPLPFRKSETRIRLVRLRLGIRIALSVLTFR